MPGTKQWTENAIKDGICECELSSWKWFAAYINQELLDYREYIFRGQSSDRWKLESTLDRSLKKIVKRRRNDVCKKHLPNFKLAVRGRRGPNPIELKDEDDWWALGQHHGLVTPLIDWTESPFVALYFAFNEVDTSGADYRVVWAFSEDSLAMIQKNEKYNNARIVRPLSDENARLVNQRGLFIRCPYGISFESAVRDTFSGVNDLMHIIKIRIPNKERTVCLRFLNRMNINHLSLFPDLTGASTYCNTDLLIKGY
jgi:hypothetical protein